MDHYCVVVCGLQAGTSDDASAWQPVAAALKLDPADFAQRVIAALPRVVRRDMDRATAERVVQLLQAMHVDARALPDDPQLAYVDRAGSTRGPLPQASLGEFIQPGEWYRLHGDTAWLPWPAAVDEDEDEDAHALTIDPDDVDGATTPTAADDEPPDVPAPPPPEATNEVSDATPEAPPVFIEDEPRQAIPPPLPVLSTAQQPASLGDPEVAGPRSDAGESAHDDELINPIDATPALADPDTAALLAQTATETAVPARSRAGRLLVLLVLVVLAVWAYRHWMADTRMGDSPAAPMTTHPSKTAAGQPAAPARVRPGGKPMPAPAASLATASSIATAATTKAPATASPIPANAGSTTTPPAAASARTQINNAAAAMVPTRSSSAPPASVGTDIPAQPSPAVATSTVPPAPSTH